MFSFFKRKERSERQGPNGLSDKVATSIVTMCIRVQEKWAGYMQRRTNPLSLKKKKCSLVLFCALSVGCSMYLILDSFTGSASKDFGVASIHMPLNATQTGEENKKLFPLITKKEFERIERFRRYVDSLGRSDVGKETRDSLIALRPGLMDSIRMIESFYQLQNAKK